MGLTKSRQRKGELRKVRPEGSQAFEKEEKMYYTYTTHVVPPVGAVHSQLHLVQDVGARVLERNSEFTGSMHCVKSEGDEKEIFREIA